MLLWDCEKGHLLDQLVNLVDMCIIMEIPQIPVQKDSWSATRREPTPYTINILIAVPTVPVVWSENGPT
jgi:hypothetical protein